MIPEGIDVVNLTNRSADQLSRDATVRAKCQNEFYRRSESATSKRLMPMAALSIHMAGCCVAAGHATIRWRASCSNDRRKMHAKGRS